MKVRIFALALALLMTMGGALAEVYAGTTVAAETVAVAAESGGTVEEAYVRAGETVEAGAALAGLRTAKVYAAGDGTVARILVQEGEKVDGAVLEINPTSRYTIYCTVDSAYQSAASTRVRVGETLYIRCTANGTHRGTGMITQIDGEEYRVEATGGEFYVGETVNLYRDAEFASAQRVGVGTVVNSDPLSCESQGYIVRLHVKEGEFVERGELLYECAEGKETELTAPVDGIVTEAAEAGASLQPGDAAFRIAPLDAMRVEIDVGETAAAGIESGDEVELIFADDPGEEVEIGEVESVSRVVEGEGYAVRIASEAIPERLGLTVNVRIGEE